MHQAFTLRVVCLLLTMLHLRAATADAREGTEHSKFNRHMMNTILSYNMMFSTLEYDQTYHNPIQVSIPFGMGQQQHAEREINGCYRTWSGNGYSMPAATSR